jgi:ribosome recycling factor
LGGYLSNLSTGNPIMALSNSRLMKFIKGKKHVEQIGEGLNKMFEKNIQDSTKEALPIIDKIIKEVDKLISYERGIS